MSAYLSQKELIQGIENNINSLENGTLSIQEIEAHTQLVRELYERTLILRYKAFELHTTVAMAQPAVEEIVAVIEAQEPEIHPAVEAIEVEEEIIEQNEVDTSSSDADFEFDLFGGSSEPIIEETINEEVVSIEELTIATTQTATTNIVEDLPVTPIHVAVQPIEEEETSEESEDFTPITPIQTSVAASNFPHLIEKAGAELRRQMGYSPLQTLVGSFGLNQRLLFINELFGSSSEAFSDAIKVIDSRSSMEEAISKIEIYSEANDWDLTSETVEEFLQIIYRRFA